MSSEDIQQMKCLMFVDLMVSKTREGKLDIEVYYRWPLPLLGFF